MHFQELIKRRRTHRSFSEKPIEPDRISRILYASTRGPSAGFTQGTRILVLSSAESRNRFWNAVATTEWRTKNGAGADLANAPVIVIVFENRQAYLDRYSEPDKAYAQHSCERDFPAPFWTIDAAFSAMLIQLAAVDEGLGYLFFGLPNGLEALSSVFRVPSHLTPIGALAIGYPTSSVASASSQRRVRLEYSEIVRFETF